MTIVDPALRPPKIEVEEDQSQKFKDRDDVEKSAIAFDADTVELLDYPWRGSMKIKVPRWTLETMFNCEGALKKLVKNLNPKTTLALLNGGTAEQAIEDVWQLWFDGIGREVVEIVGHTLGLKQDEEKDEFLEWHRTVSPEDTLQVFVQIVHNQITNPRIRAILKNLFALLEETMPQVLPSENN